MAPSCASASKTQGENRECGAVPRCDQTTKARRHRNAKANAQGTRMVRATSLRLV